MLNKRNRISNPRTIEKLFRRGIMLKDSSFIFKYEKTDDSPSRFAVSVSKKIQKKATKRNLLRRRIYEAIRLNLPHLNSDITALVILRNQESGNLTFQEISKRIYTFFNSVEHHAK